MYSATAFVLLALVCTVLAFQRHPIYGLYFYLATTYIYPPGRWWGQMLPDLRWALLSAAVTVLAVLFHRGKLRDKPLWLGSAPAVIITLYCIWMWLQTPWALEMHDHLNGVVILTKYLLGFWFVYRIVDSADRVRDLLLAHVLGCGLLGVYAHLIGRDGDRLDGVGGPGIDDANTLGMYLVTAAIIGTGLVLTQQGWRRYLSLACLVVIANGFVLTNSRGSFLGLVAGGLVLAVCKAKQHRWLFWSFALVGLMALVVVMDKAFIDRMFTIQDATSQDEAADMSARSRVELAKAQLQMFLEHPMGTGHRGTAVLSTLYLESKWLTRDKGGDESTLARSSHNTFLTALVEQGLPGGILFIILSLWTVMAMLRIRRMRGPAYNPALTTLGASMCGALAVIFVAGNTADYLLAEVQFWLFAALVSMLWLSERDKPAEHPSSKPVGMRQAAA